MLFTELNLPDYILQAVEKIGISNPTEIQEKTIPELLAGKDIIGKSFTGSGKTFAFGIPSVVLTDTTKNCIQTLIVCPTRELACQVCDEIRKLNEFHESCKIVPVFGGSSIDRQIQAIKKGAKIIVGTPGRIMDLIERRILKLQLLNLLVLDEADEMLDMGFKPDIEAILKATNNTHQTAMFSATMPKPILEIAENYMKNPIQISVKDSLVENKTIKQFFINVDKKQKTPALLNLYSEVKPSLSIIFCNTKKMVTDLEKQFHCANLPALSLHGDMRQSERKRVLQSIKNGDCNILIATDVAARGIDINNVETIFNYDIPYDPEYYTHRIGRTARAGKTGSAYTIISGKAQIKQIDELKQQLKVDIEEIKNSFSLKIKETDVYSNKSRSLSKKQTGNKLSPKKQKGDEFYTDKKRSSKIYRDEKKCNIAHIEDKKTRHSSKGFNEPNSFSNKKTTTDYSNNKIGQKSNYIKKSKDFSNESSFNDKKAFRKEKNSISDIDLDQGFFQSQQKKSKYSSFRKNETKDSNRYSNSKNYKRNTDYKTNKEGNKDTDYKAKSKFSSNKNSSNSYKKRNNSEKSNSYNHFSKKTRSYNKK